MSWLTQENLIGGKRKKAKMAQDAGIVDTDTPAQRVNPAEQTSSQEQQTTESQQTDSKEE